MGNSPLTKVSRILLAGYAFISFFVLAYAILIAHRLIPDLLTPIFSSFFIFAVPALILAFSVFGLLFSKRETAINIAFALFSITLAVYFVEAFMTVMSKKTPRFETIQRLRAEGRNAGPAVFPSLLLEESGGVTRSVIRKDGKETLPLAGRSNAVNVVCNESGRDLIFTSDKFGFHNPPAIWESKAPIDVAAIGDSFTLGFCVPSDKNLVAKIREKFPRTVNLGGGGGGPLIDLALLKEYATRLKSKVVLWVYAENDLGRDLDKEKNSALLLNYLTPQFSQNLFSRQTEIDALLHDYVENSLLQRVKGEKNLEISRNSILGKVALFLRVPHMRALLIPKMFQTLADDYEFANPDFPLFERVLKEARKTTSSWGGKIVFVYIPSPKRYGGEKIMPGSRDPEEFKQDVLTLVSRLGIQAVDLDKYFRENAPEPRNLYVRMGSHLITFYGHLNEDGYAMAAKAVLQTLQSGEGPKSAL